MAKKSIDLTKHIWEGWRVIDFINELEPTLDYMYQNHRSWGRSEPFMTKAQIREWCKDNQPYYKKRIPEVTNYFIQKYNIKK